MIYYLITYFLRDYLLDHRDAYNVTHHLHCLQNDTHTMSQLEDL